MTSNINLPPLQVLVNNQFMLKKPGYTPGILIQARALQNQAIQFSVLLNTGALYTGLPINAITTKPVKALSLSQCAPFDAIDSSIECIVLDTLRHMPCTVKFFDSTPPKEGKYLLTIDMNGNGLSRHPVQWKQNHLIELNTGHLVLYQQYRIQFKDLALCEKSLEKMPSYCYNDKIWLAE